MFKISRSLLVEWPFIFADKGGLVIYLLMISVSYQYRIFLTAALPGGLVTMILHKLTFAE